MKFFRYHALGNDYLVLRPKDMSLSLSSKIVQRICHRHFGIGSDGILLHCESKGEGAFRLRIYNPDGSEAEKSGNGLRIFSRYLWDEGLVSHEPFSVDTLGGRVRCVVSDGGRIVTVDMGRVSFMSTDIPVAGRPREVIKEEIEVDGKVIAFCAATIGNPHCVVTNLEVSEEVAKRMGPSLENHPLFPNRTNVQFLKVLDRKNIAIEIWERGAGYTLASGSSSSAAAAVAHKLGLVDGDVTVKMPGGSIQVTVSDNFDIRMTGGVTKVGQIDLSMEAVEDLV